MAKSVADIAQTVAAVVAAGLVLHLLKKLRQENEVSHLTCGSGTFSQQQYQVYAHEIYGHVWGDIFENESAVIDIIATMRNDADVCELIKSYGVRGPIWAVQRGLAQTVRDYLSANDRKELNDRLAAKGITYIF